MYKEEFDKFKFDMVALSEMLPGCCDNINP